MGHPATRELNLNDAQRSRNGPPARALSRSVPYHTINIYAPYTHVSQNRRDMGHPGVPYHNINIYAELRSAGQVRAPAPT